MFSGEARQPNSHSLLFNPTGTSTHYLPHSMQARHYTIDVVHKIRWNTLLFYNTIYGFGFMAFNATFNNISATSWRSVWLIEEAGENHRPAASHWQTYYFQNMQIVHDEFHFLDDIAKLNCILKLLTLYIYWLPYPIWRYHVCVWTQYVLQNVLSHLFVYKLVWQ